MGILIKIKHVEGDHFEAEGSGDIRNIITDQDRKDFDVCDKELKIAAGRVLKKNPSDAFLRRPTPWDDMYKKWELDEVTKVTRVKNAEVIDVSTQTVAVKTQHFINKESPVATNFNASLEETVNNTVSSTWNNENCVEVGQSISYDIKAISGETSLNYKRTWGSTETKSQSVELKCASSMGLTLEPGQSVSVALMAHKKNVKIKITYESYLFGHVAMNYHGGYNGHTYYFEPIEDIMEHCNINNSRIVTEIIELDIFGDCSITVKDLN